MKQPHHLTLRTGMPVAPRAVCGLILAMLLTGCATRRTVTDKMMWSACPVATLHGMASGFVLKSRDSKGHDTAVVVTCAHVMKTMREGPVIVCLHHQDQNGGVDPEPVIIIPARGAMRDSFYVKHPTHDLAAFCLTVPDKARKLLGLDSIPDEQTLTSAELRAGDEVSFLGYPDVYPGTRGAFALLRSGRIASYPASGAMAGGRFLINADVYPGDSGAPVFLTMRTGRPQVVGVLTSRIGADKSSFSHLAVAVNVDAIRETLALLKKLPPVAADFVERPGRSR
ncbi:serine protease [Prosthecobacter sp.]|uniref:serine protease n=1 Tax=Prosthecobacter sp. TaxID=1965333 RepID=UPI0037844C6C